MMCTVQFELNNFKIENVSLPFSLMFKNHRVVTERNKYEISELRDHFRKLGRLPDKRSDVRAR